MLDMLRSIVATYEFKKTVKSFFEEFGADFTQHLYVPEIDPVTGIPHHERGDQNHVLKRVAACTRNGNYPDLNFEAFVEAMRSPNTGLTYTALAGKRKQSVVDAERLLSYHVANFFRGKGYENEYQYVKVIAQWHESSDGRGISQLKRSQYNYEMLNYLLDEWMPWHKDDYDFSKIDINRPVEYIRGFTREVVIEITANIESQEMRRCQNSEIGYPEHPRAGSTEDLECFFGVAHSRLGNIFTLKEFKDGWPKLVMENSKRLSCETLPFYYWTENDRFKEGHLDSFDVIPGQVDNEQGDESAEEDGPANPLRLHRLMRNQRESVAHFVSGRAFLPARNDRTVRQQHHRPRSGVPPPSGFLFSIEEENE
ncbi:uncharacterized protein [Montipora capricornis]|uniref:uncharacterized protein isoform X1 n=1 Tax=Montipora capricornis TaxID=246305 RepID=UPI0035F1277B